MDYIYNLSPDIKTRDRILFGTFSPDRYFGGITRFEGLTVQKLKDLMEQNFIDPDECQNDAPSVREIMAFMTKYPVFQAHGYAVTDKRDDYRIDLEGVKATQPLKADERIAFAKLFRDATEFDLDDGFCWYD